MTQLSGLSSWWQTIKTCASSNLSVSNITQTATRGASNLAVIVMEPQRYRERAEDLRAVFCRFSKHALPHFARFCLIATFMEDSLRIWLQWKEHRDYFNSIWHMGSSYGNIFLTIIVFGQLLGCVMVMMQKMIPTACGILSMLIVFQISAYAMWDFHTVTRELSLVGGLIILAATDQVENRSLLAGVPNTGENKRKTLFQLLGRILLLLMFVAVLTYDWTFYKLMLRMTDDVFTYFVYLFNMVGSSLVVLVAIGFKTRVSTAILAICMLMLNMWVNAWWTTKIPEIQDFMRFYFFQTVSVIGGLLLVMIIGPGSYSLDEYKKFQ